MFLNWLDMRRGESEVSPSPHPRICLFFILWVGEGLVTDHNGKGTEILLSESSHHEQADLKISGRLGEMFVTSVMKLKTQNT